MSFLPTVAASVPTHRGCPPGAKPAEHSPQWLWGPRYSLGAACHSIQLSSYKHHSLAPHRTAPHRTPRLCVRAGSTTSSSPESPSMPPPRAPSPEPVPRTQPAPPGPAHRPRAAMPRCPGTALRRRQALPAPALATACGVTLLRAAWQRSGDCGRKGGPDSSRVAPDACNFSPFPSPLSSPATLLVASSAKSFLHPPALVPFG